MSSLTTSSPTRPQPQSHQLEIPTDEELQRGRKRRRSSGGSQSMHITSHGSTNLRGRGRRRSPTPSRSFPHSSLEGTHRSASPRKKAPGKKYQKKEVLALGRREKKRRSQSPSRSRSLGKREGTPKPRRRQRTRTRSRSHGEKDEGLERDSPQVRSGGNEVEGQEVED